MPKSYVSPKQSAYCPECFRWPQQERTKNRGERLCSSGHVFTLQESREAYAREYPENAKEAQMLNQNDPRITQPKVIKVGVFGDLRASGKAFYMAYTTWYNPQWKGCCEHEVEAINGTEAKKLAIKEHKEQCVDAKR